MTALFPEPVRSHGSVHPHVKHTVFLSITVRLLLVSSAAGGPADSSWCLELTLESVFKLVSERVHETSSGIALNLQIGLSATVPLWQVFLLLKFVCFPTYLCLL